MPAGKEYKQTDPALEEMNYLVDGGEWRDK